MVLEPYVLEGTRKRIIDSSCFTPPAAVFVKNEFVKGSFEQTEMENQYIAMVKAVEKTGTSSTRHGSSRKESLPADISDDEKTNYRAYSDSRSKEDQESSRRRIEIHKKRSKHGHDRHFLRLPRSQSLKLSFADKSIAGLLVIISING